MVRRVRILSLTVPSAGEGRGAALLSAGQAGFIINAYTVKKEKKIFLMHKEFQKGSGAKSYMSNGLLIYD